MKSKNHVSERLLLMAASLWLSAVVVMAKQPPSLVPDKPSAAPDRPYLLASLYDNECTAVSIINRNIKGIYQQKRVPVSIQPLRYDRKVGIFGYCQSLTLRYQYGLPSGSFTVYAQDLASDDAPTAVPYTLTSDGRGIIIQGTDLESLTDGHDYPYSEVVREEGKDYTDLSDPAVVLLVVPE